MLRLFVLLLLIPIAAWAERPVRSEFNIAYSAANGWDPALTALDVHMGPGSRNAPVMVFVHGGSWIGGDKANAAPESDFVQFLLGQGLTVVALNIRLQKNVRSPGTSYSDQATDIARGLKWVHSHIADYGGDPKNVSLLGFSSGAHLVALVGTDPKYLTRVGLSRSFLRSVTCLDVHAYDVPLAIRLMAQYPIAVKIPFLKSLFGETEAEQREASPTSYVSKGHSYPAFLIVSSAQNPRNRNDIAAVTSQSFHQFLTRAGVSAIYRHFPNENHSDLVRDINSPNDGPGQLLAQFIDERIHENSRYSRFNSEASR